MSFMTNIQIPLILKSNTLWGEPQLHKSEVWSSLGLIYEEVMAVSYHQQMGKREGWSTNEEHP